MTVQELINHLQQFNPNTQVMFSHTDHTDFLYKINMSVNDVYTGNDDEYSIGDEDLFDSDGMILNNDDDYTGPEVVLFNLSLD